MRILLLMGLVMLASLFVGCRTPEQQSARQSDRQLEQTLRALEQDMQRMDHKLDEINRKLDQRNR